VVFANPSEVVVVVWSTKMSDPTLKFAKGIGTVYTTNKALIHNLFVTAQNKIYPEANLVIGSQTLACLSVIVTWNINWH
jgi:hypothetical protein